MAAGEGHRHVSNGRSPRLDTATAAVEVKAMTMRRHVLAPSRRVMRSRAAMNTTDSKASAA